MASTRSRRLASALATSVLVVLFGASGAIFGVCGPFTDTATDAFCPFVLEIFYLGITTGTTSTTYDPSGNVTRLQMAAFLSRTVDGVLKRGSRRAALKRFWTPQNTTALGLTTVGSDPDFVESDGADLWVSDILDNSVSRVRGSDGKLLETWTGAGSAAGVLVAMGGVFVAGAASPGNLYQIDPTQVAGGVTTVASNLGNNPVGIAFDGLRIWTANTGSPGSVSIVTPGATIPWTVTTLSVGVGSTRPTGALFDGVNIWITDNSLGTLLKLDGTGAVLQTVTLGNSPNHPVFDGANIWVPNEASFVSVVRASSGAVLATLTGNGSNHSRTAAFDGQRVLVTDPNGGSISLWKAADLTTLGSLALGGSNLPAGACSDGVDFWVTLQIVNKLARF